VLFDGESFQLLDVDLFCMGDPALDVGNFSGHLMEQGVRDAGDVSLYSSVQQAFESRYLELAGERSKKAIDVYTWLTFARHIFLSTQFIDRSHTTVRLLEIFEEHTITGS
jgi:hypothetical protein